MAFGKNADHIMQGSNEFVSVPQYEPSLCLLRAELRRSGCGVWRERRQSFLDQRRRWERSEGDQSHTDQHHPGLTFRARSWVMITHFLGYRRRVGGQWFVKQGGACLGKLDLPRQGAGSWTGQHQQTAGPACIDGTDGRSQVKEGRQPSRGVHGACAACAGRLLRFIDTAQSVGGGQCNGSSVSSVFGSWLPKMKLTFSTVPWTRWEPCVLERTLVKRVEFCCCVCAMLPRTGSTAATVQSTGRTQPRDRHCPVCRTNFLNGAL